MYAVIETGGKQYRVQEGDVITVEKLNVEAGETVVFDKVLLMSDGKEVKVGAPYVDGAKVTISTESTTEGYLKKYEYKEACKNMWNELTEEEIERYAKAIAEVLDDKNNAKLKENCNGGQ